MTDPDLTAPEAVERLASHIHKTCGCALGANEEQPVAATLRALSAALAAEKAENATLKSAVYIDDLTVTGLASDKADLKARAEAAEARLKEAVEIMQRVKDYRYDPNIGIELNRLEAHLSSLEGDKPDE